MTTTSTFSSGDPADPRWSQALRRAQEALLALQQPDGHWRADLLADTTVNSDYIMMLNFLGRPDPEKIAKLARYILQEQLPDGGWPIYRNGPSDISATVKAYWALKFAGHRPDEPPLARARERIEQLGGIHRINTFSKCYLALYGQYDWRGVPTIPPEIIFFPSWFYFNVYAMSSWTRAIVIPLSIVSALKFQQTPPSHATLDELFPDERRYRPLSQTVTYGDVRDRFWKKLCFALDALLKGMERGKLFVCRCSALKKAEAWMRQHQEGSEGIGAIFPPMVNTVFAYRALGYDVDHPAIQQEGRELARFEVDRGDHIQIQPCLSPVWDTAIALNALLASGLAPDDSRLRAAARWLLDREVRVKGDWAVNNPDGPAAGWIFEYANPWYPDIDDTIMVMMGLRPMGLEGADAACRRGLEWLLSMQCADGGWASFDRDNTKKVLTKMPFADHNAMIDPPTVDITARVLECLARFGFDLGTPEVERARVFIEREQEADGSWYGRWGVNYIYGTWQVLKGLADIGEDMSRPYVQRAVQWLLSVQQADGGWGERCETYDDPGTKGSGPSTPSQTAWALMGLIAAGHEQEEAVQRGVDYLVRTQRADGNWDEAEFTGTGFPKVFYLEYTLYRLSFPLMALGLYRSALARQTADRPRPEEQGVTAHV